ncbi:MAG: transglutaminase domain-containing protein [Deltaproteobacteria bacterium]|nr:transglutaminase domain-containing protein [Deltaproteobacteria bacterium]
MIIKKTCAIFILSALLLVLDFAPVQAKSRTFEMTYKAKIAEIPANAKKIDLWLPYPVSDEAQQILDMKIESPFPAHVNYDKEFGNGILYINTKPGTKSFEVKMTFLVKRRELRQKNLPKEVSTKQLGNKDQFYRYLTASKYAVINDKVRFFAQKATKDKKGISEKAKGAYDFILENMSYDKVIPGWGKGDVNRVCINISDGKEGTGNCTDFHSFFGSIMRASGIPVVFEMGFPLNPSKDLPEGIRGGYHCWAKFYLPGKGWVPVDISEADKAPEKKDYYFGSIDEHRVRFSRGRDILLEPNQKGERLNYFGPDPYLEIDGIASDNFERWISYGDI